MSTMNFSVPEDVKQAFNTAFEGQNKSAVLTQLMRDAVAQVEERRRREAAMQRILARREQSPVFTAEQIEAAREEGRP